MFTSPQRRYDRPDISTRTPGGIKVVFAGRPDKRARRYEICS
ncbi:MAG: hypothetical protein AAF199_00090 [Pseudomonadota bacterium]